MFIWCAFQVNILTFSAALSTVAESELVSGLGGVTVLEEEDEGSDRDSLRLESGKAYDFSAMKGIREEKARTDTVDTYNPLNDVNLSSPNGD